MYDILYMEVVVMILMFIIKILLAFTVSMALTIITMETLKLTLWLWHVISITYFIILCFIFIV